MRRTMPLPSGQVRPVEALMKPQSTTSPFREVRNWALHKVLDYLLWGGIALTGWNRLGDAFDWVSRSKYHSWSKPIITCVSSLIWMTEAAALGGWLPRPRTGERDPFSDP
jgi:hypothetical protein